MTNFIPPEIIDELMQRANIVDVVSDYVALKRRGRNHFGLCPFHNEDTPSFSVNEDKKIYKCFGCGKGGNVIGFVQEVEHINFGEAARMLAERYQLTIPEKALSEEEQRRYSLRQSMLAAHTAAAECYTNSMHSSRTAHAYLEKRGISRQMAERFGLGAAPADNWHALYDHLSGCGFSDEVLLAAGLVSKSSKNGRCYDKFHSRLIFPIRDLRGTVVAFGGRSMGDEQPKYLNSQTTAIYNKSNLLYALDLAADSIREQRQLVIMEGYMDVLTAHSYGVTNTVASLGTAFTEQHARLLNRFVPEDNSRLQVLLAFDGDAAGEKAARMSLDKLAAYDFIEPRVLVFPNSMDPDEFLRSYGQRGWNRLLERYCYPRLDYLLQRALTRHDISTAAGKAAIVGELTAPLRQTVRRTEADSFIRELAHKLQVDENSIRSDLSHSSTSATASTAAAQNITRAGQKIFRSGHPANRQLLLQAICDPKIFAHAQQSLGELFPSTEEEAQLITLIDQLGEHYNFQPSSLFNYIDKENEGLRQFLLKLLQSEIIFGNYEEYISAIQQHHLQDQISLLQKQIAMAEAQHQDTSALVQEKLLLTQKLKGRRS